jgi:hypothetical protein
VSDSDIIPGRAAGYERTPSGTLRNQAWVAPALNRTADGSLYSTVLDLARWDEALGSGRILTREELARMWSIDPLRSGESPLLHYGYGWETNRLRGHRVIEYDGNWQGFQAAMARYEDRRMTVIVLTNLALCRVQRIAHTVAGYFDARVAHFAAAAADTHPDLTHEFRAFVSDVGRGSTFAALSAAHPAFERAGTAWTAALARDLHATGAIGATSFAEEQLASGHLERVYRVETAGMVDFFTVRYAEGGDVEHIDLYHEY